MNKKIIAVDLDETLLCSDKSISDGNLRAMEEMITAGHIFAVDTGRTLFGMTIVTDRYDFFKKENVYIIGTQGGLLYYPYKDSLLYMDFMDVEPAVKLAKEINDSNITFLGFDESFMYVFENNDEVKKYNEISDCPTKIISSVDELRDKKLCKIMAISYDNTEKLHAFEHNCAGKYSDTFTYMFSTPNYFEFIPNGVSKGNGLKNLADILNIPVENTIACGDERNDISMIEMAGLGVCVSNGFEDVKSIADYVTIRDNNHDAIAEVIDKFILEK